MSRFRHPEGARLPALERNILKYRAFEMMQMLFYAEELKDFVQGAVRASTQWRALDNSPIPKGSPNWRAAMAVLVAEGIISQAENDEIAGLMAFRNNIAHEIQELTFDIGRSRFAREYQEFTTPKYDYGALRKIRYWQEELSDRMASKYVFELSFDHLRFEAAERTYSAERKKLRKKITAQTEARRARVEKLRKELSLEGLPRDLHPYHPANTRRNGTLSARGIEVCFRLFDAGKSSLAVGYLMRISKRAAMQHQKRWKKAGGPNRVQTELPPLDLSLKSIIKSAADSA